MRNFFTATIAAATFGSVLAFTDETVAQALRKIQQGINEANIDDATITADLKQKVEDLISLVEEGSKVSLEKIQKGKDDAWTLIFGGAQTFLQGSPTDHVVESADESVVHVIEHAEELVVDPEEFLAPVDPVVPVEEVVPVEPVPWELPVGDDEPLADECIMWSSPNYRGEKVSWSNIAASDPWQYLFFDITPTRYGSLKCGPDINALLYTETREGPMEDLLASKPAANAHGYVTVTSGTGATIKSVTAMSNAGHDDLGYATIFGGAACTKASTTLWSSSEDWPQWHVWDVEILTHQSPIVSVRVPNGMKLTVYHDESQTGESQTIIGKEDISSGQANCQTVTLANARWARADW